MNKFIVYNKFGKRIGLEARKIVHKKGLWHRGVQLNIYSQGKILIQNRSKYCDIAWGLKDQSLAVQMLEPDKENEQKALERGLLDELGVNISLLPKPKKVAGPYKIEKTYSYAPKLKNNEFVTLYRIDLDKPTKFNLNSHKVESIEWMDVEELRRDVAKNSDKYTKTLSFWLDRKYI